MWRPSPVSKYKNMGYIALEKEKRTSLADMVLIANRENSPGLHQAAQVMRISWAPREDDPDNLSEARQITTQCWMGETGSELFRQGGFKWTRHQLQMGESGLNSTSYPSKADFM
jgi:hypothetical protein